MNDQTQPHPGRILAALLCEHLGNALGEFADFLNRDGDDGRPGPHGADCGCGHDTDSPRIAEYAWEARFASDVHKGALVAMNAGSGMRALRVTERREVERTTLGGPVQRLAFLVVDLDSDEPASLELAPNEALRVAFEVPSSAADLAGGAA